MGEHNDQDGIAEGDEGYDAEGRIHKIEYNKLDWQTDFAFYDVTDDCIVDISDSSQLTNAFGAGIGNPAYNPRYDLNSDGYIDFTDIGAVNGSMFGRSCPRFVYDAGGNLMKLEGPKRMVYIGGIYKKNLDTGAVTKYYHSADGRRLAMWKGETGSLYFFANDHLGSTALVTDASGYLVSETFHYPYGNVWTQENGAPPTDRLFTGQRRYGAKSGIYHYGARFYSADIGRFLSPDSIVPGAGDPQALNRYSYVLNNPPRFTDPSGHCIPDINCPPGLGGGTEPPVCTSCGGGGGGGAGGGGGPSPTPNCEAQVWAPGVCPTPAPTPGDTSFETETVFIDATRECNLTKVPACAFVGGWEKLDCWPPPAPVQGGLGATTCTLSSGGGFFAKLEGEKSWEGDRWAIEMRLELCNSSNVQPFCASESKYVVNVYGYTYDFLRNPTEDEPLDAPYSGPAGSFDYGGVLELKEDPSYLEVSFFIADAGLRYFYHDFNSGLTYTGPVRSANVR